MSDPYDMPTCSTCGDVAMYCKCIEKLNDEWEQEYRDGKKCPKCQHRDSIVKIEYGYPGHEMLEKYKKDEIKLGGWMVTDVDPDYHCNKCNYEWSKDNPHYGSYAESDEEE